MADLFQQDTSFIFSNLPQTPLSIITLHDSLKTKFEQVCYEKGIPEVDVSEKWKNVWNNEILDISFDGQSFREAADVNKFGLNYAISALLRSTTIIPITTLLIWVPIILLIYFYAEQKLDLLTSIQIGLILTFILAAFWHMFVLHNLTDFPLTFRGIELPGTIVKEFKDDINNLEGEEIHPKNIHVMNKFYKILRGYQLKLLTSAVIWDISLLLILVGSSFGVIYLVDTESAKLLGNYHTIMAYGLLIAGAGLILSFYVFSVVLQNFRTIGAAIVVALLSSGLPFLIDYLLGGDLNVSGAREAIFAGTGGLTVALVTAITSNVKESLD